MKIDENLVNRAKKRVYAKSYSHTIKPNGISDDDLFFLINFHPKGEPEASMPCGLQLTAPTLLIVKLKPGGLKWLMKKAKKK